MLEGPEKEARSDQRLLQALVRPRVALPRKDALTQDGRVPGSLSRRPRVCVVDSGASGPAYDRLDEVAIDVMAVLPRLAEVDTRLLANFDLVLVGCTETLLMNPGFARTVAKVSQYTRLVGIASRPDPELAARAARIGFHGFVAREVSPDALERALAAVINGEMAFPRTAMSAVIRLIRRAYKRLPMAEGEVELTPRQRQIVDLIAQGANDREIADTLRISPSTVHKHVQNALKRTRTKTRSHLAAALGHST
jgi:DNA-binding NarL/FixJ family response regulator